MTTVLLALYFAFIVRLVFVVGEGFLSRGENTPGFTFRIRVPQ